ncbi:hypothetical protein GCM10027428_15740 [Haliea atlantica]
MASHQHDTGYKELFSHPEFVQQLMEGFAPPEIAALMDFDTLQIHSGNYVTPLFEEKFEDVVWSVQIDWQGLSSRACRRYCRSYCTTAHRAGRRDRTFTTGSNQNHPSFCGCTSPTCASTWLTRDAILKRNWLPDNRP